MSHPYLGSGSYDENSVLSSARSAGPGSARTGGSGSTPRDDRFNTPRMYTARSNSTDEFTSPRTWSENGSDYGTPRQGQYPTPRGGPNSARGGPSPRIVPSPRQHPSPRQMQDQYMRQGQPIQPQHYQGQGGEDPNMYGGVQQNQYQQQQQQYGAGGNYVTHGSQYQQPPPHNGNGNVGANEQYFQNSFATQQQQHYGAPQQHQYGQPIMAQQQQSSPYYGNHMQTQQQQQYQAQVGGYNNGPSPSGPGGGPGIRAPSLQQYPTLRNQHQYDSQYKQFEGNEYAADSKNTGGYTSYGHHNAHPSADSKQQYHLQHPQHLQQPSLAGPQEGIGAPYHADAKHGYDGGNDGSYASSPAKDHSGGAMDPELEYRRHVMKQQQEQQHQQHQQQHQQQPTIDEYPVEGGKGADMSEVEAAMEQVYAAGMSDQDVDDIFSFARHGRVDEIDRLLDKGIPVDVRDAHGNTLLTTACQNGNKRVAKCVLRRAANINSRNNKGNTPLHYCFSYGYGDSLGQYLIDKGADVRARNLAGKGIYDGI